MTDVKKILQATSDAIANSTANEIKEEESRLVRDLVSKGELPLGLTITPHRGFQRLRLKSRRPAVTGLDDPSKLPF